MKPPFGLDTMSFVTSQVSIVLSRFELSVTNEAARSYESIMHVMVDILVFERCKKQLSPQMA